MDKRHSRNIICIFVLLTTFFISIKCATISDSKQLMTDLLNGYDPEIRPLADQTSLVNVSVSVYVKAIQEFNEVKETFLFTAVFVLTWYDVSIVWNPASYGGLTSIMLSIDKVWVPQLVITTSSSHIVSFGQDWQKVLYFANGAATWSTGGLVRGTCSINVRNYPFDSQKCASHFSPGPYYAHHVSFVAYSKEVNMSIYAGNVIWDLHQTSVSVQNVNLRSQLEVTLNLRRKSAFVVINVLIPLASLSFLNILVFLLVPCSGERVSYSITVLLAIAVFMTIISDTLTKSSEPVPLISYKLMTDMIISALITVVTIVNLGIYHRPETTKIPKWLITIYTKFYRYKLNICANRINPKRGEVQEAGKTNNVPNELTTSPVGNKKDIVSIIDTADADELVEAPSETSEPATDNPVTWKQISFMIDFMSIVLFVAVSSLSFLIFIVYLYF